MTALVTAQDVVDNSFTDNTVDPFIIKDYFIEVAQEEHIRPLLSQDLYDVIIAGSLDAAHTTLLNDYIKPCLWFYVKFEVIADMSIHLTSKGTMISDSDFGTAASSRDRNDLQNKAKRMGDTLADKLIRYIDDNSSSFPTYEGASRNITQVKGGIIL